MNITQTMPKPEDVPENNFETWRDLLVKRKEVYIGFAKVEARNGLPNREWVSLSTKQGQDLARNLWARGFEEILESTASESREHQLEELIDAFNFFLSLALLDPMYAMAEHRETLVRGFTKNPVNWGRYKSDRPKIFHFEDFLSSETMRFFESLRNRAWQNSIQSHYFDGFFDLEYMIERLYHIIGQYFKNYEEFMAYYMAKEKVLVFRLETAY